MRLAGMQIRGLVLNSPSYIFSTFFFGKPIKVICLFASVDCRMLLGQFFITMFCQYCQRFDFKVTETKNRILEKQYLIFNKLIVNFSARYMILFLIR